MTVKEVLEQLKSLSNDKWLPITEKELLREEWMNSENVWAARSGW